MAVDPRTEEIAFGYANASMAYNTTSNNLAAEQASVTNRSTQTRTLNATVMQLIANGQLTGQDADNVNNGLRMLFGIVNRENTLLGNGPGGSENGLSATATDLNAVNAILTAGTVNVGNNFATCQANLADAMAKTTAAQTGIDQSAAIGQSWGIYLATIQPLIAAAQARPVNP
jgi:hypothetical protein